MSTSTKQWTEAFRAACRDRAMRFVGGEGFLLGEVYLAAVSALVFDADGDRLRIDWHFDVKPLAVDDVLWAAFTPETQMSPQMRINRRINGSCQVPPLELQRGVFEVCADDEPAWDALLDRFDAARRDFLASYPTAADFVTALADHPDRVAPNRAITRQVAALIAGGHAEEAAIVADRAIATGQRGNMSRTTDVLKYLSAYAKGPAAYAVFTESLRPTHDYRVLYRSRDDRWDDLSREHHRGMIAAHLAEMDGSDPWAVLLERRTASGTLHYLQAGGSADAMVVELCEPDGTDPAGVSVRSVLGHRAGSNPAQNVAIELPHGAQRVSAAEVFTAAEAAVLFDTFYRTDTIAQDIVRRPVESYPQPPR